jgi:KDO2-lipid IV(A) lauroyltransferase
MIRHGARKILHQCVEVPLEGLGLLLVFLILRLLPLSQATKGAAWVGRKVGPWFIHTRRARENLQKVYPEKDPLFIEKIIEGMWDNLGRVIAEYAHLDHIRLEGKDPHVEIKGLEILEELKRDEKPALLVGAHLAHWEMITLTATAHQLPISQVYRQANNPLGNFIIRRLQKLRTTRLIPKGPGAGRLTFAALRKGHHLIMLMDQKLNTGISSPFFGRPAMTSPAAARFALHFSCPLVPVQVIRKNRGTQFQVIYHPPLPLPSTGDMEADVSTLTAQINLILEDWIRQNPEQWLWIHRRWPHRPLKE